MLALSIDTMLSHVIKNGGGRRDYIQWGFFSFSFIFVYLVYLLLFAGVALTLGRAAPPPSTRPDG